MSRTSIMITAPRGFVDCLSKEVRDLGYTIVWAGTTGVRTEGSFVDAMNLNLHLRTGHRVLYKLAAFRCADADQLYEQISSFPWENIIPVDGHLTIISNVTNETIKDSRYANQRCKDAIVDRLQRKKGKRPDSGPEATGAVINLYWPSDECQVYLDTSGTPLSHRGYREVTVAAPMQETLAAAVIRTSVWRPEVNFVNPMCGSGTLAIEAALMASHRAPGLTRESFGFMHTLLYEKTAWQRLVEDARKAVVPVKTVILGCDEDHLAVKAARQNAEIASVGRYIKFEVADFKESLVPVPPGIVVINPEYGIRIGKKEELNAEYRAIGTFLKKKCKGFTGYLFTAESKLAGQVGLKSKRHWNFWNGQIACRLYEYDLF